MKLTIQNIRLFGLSCFLLTATAFSKDEEVPRLGLLFEGSFIEAELTRELVGAKKTQLVAAYKGLLGVQLVKNTQWQEAGWAWDLFLKEAGKVADDLVKKIKPVYMRDDRQVIEYAIVQNNNPFLSSAITSPEFGRMFEETLGKKLHVVIVDRNVLYVFPASGGKLRQYAESIRQRFNKTPLPVSLEVLEVTKDGFRVIGEIEQPLKTRINKIEK